MTIHGKRYAISDGDRAGNPLKNHKKIIQTIVTSIRSSDYVAICGGGNGVSCGSQLSRRLARGPLPGGKEEEDNNSTPFAFDVDDGKGDKVVQG